MDSPNCIKIKAILLPLMAHLTELSTELLVIVCSHLSAADKARVLRVCKLLQQVAEQALYTDIRLRWRFPISNISLHGLLATVVTTPAIASHVKHFQTVGPRNKNIWYGPRPLWLSDENFAIISGLARSASTAGEEEQWAEDAEHGNSDLFQALLISQLPNITQLTIGHDSCSSFRYLVKMFERVLCCKKAINGLSRFHHLKRVNICVDMTSRDLEKVGCFNLDLTYLLLFFYLPSIRDMRIVMRNYLKDHAWPTTQPCTNSLTSLFLKASDCSEAFLERVLAVTPNLKSLNYDFITSKWSPVVSSYLCANDLGRALAHVKKTLEQLTLSVQVHCLHDELNEDDSLMCGIIGSLSLHEHESLVRLEVPTVVLLGQSRNRETHLAGRLPPRMRWLYLRDDMALFKTYVWRSGAVLGIFREYLSHHREHNATLETVGLKLYESKDDWDCDLQGEFRKMFEGINVTPEIDLVRSDA